MDTENIKIAYAREIGTYHMTSGLPCQDYVSGYCGDGCSIIALADGAGSYEKSEIASQTVVNTLINAIREDFDFWYKEEEGVVKDYLIEICHKAVRNIDAEVIPSTTLLAYAISNDDREIIIHIGDGFILGVDYGWSTTTLSLPENGDEPNQTFFISDNNAREHIRITRGLSLDIKGVLLASDGAAASLVDRVNEKYASAIGKMMKLVDNTEQEVASRIIGSELNELFRLHTPDDMSIGILVKTAI